MSWLDYEPTQLVDFVVTCPLNPSMIVSHVTIYLVGNGFNGYLTAFNGFNGTQN